jgi:acyl transferase domain-containing protein
MGRSLYDKALAVRNCMDRADKLFAPEGFKVTKACFLGSAEDMARPSVAAPCLFAIHCGIIDALRIRRIAPQFACASGLFELSMACSLGGLPFDDTIRALRGMALELEEGKDVQAPSLPDPSPGPWSLYSLKSGERSETWSGLWQAQAWLGAAEEAFAQAVSAMRAEGMDTFVEIGPGELMGQRVRALDSGIRVLASHDAKALSAALKLAL